MLRCLHAITTMTKLKTKKRSIGKQVQMLSKVLDFGFKVEDGLEDGTKAILLNTQRRVFKSFTKNFKGSDRPIDSGQLRQSVASRSTGRGQGEVSINKNYAVHVEFGTRYMPPRPVFRNGISDAEEENRDILVKAIEKRTV